MLLRLVIALLILGAVILALRWLAKTPPPTIARVLRRGGIGVGIALLIYLAASGRLHWLYALVGSLIPVVYRLSALLGLVPLIQRLSAMKHTVTSAAGPAPGQSSKVQTRYLRMLLDHDTGAMNGEVLAGRFEGRQLGQLTQDELLELLDECRANDKQSQALLEAYLDRVHGDSWRDQRAESSDEEAASAATHSQITRTEAYEILGLSPGAAAQQIVEAHRRLMQKLHPDRGGSTYLAAKLNQAKEVLLGK
ncbi:MAG: DnaJ domain-containing protein [Acidiferrobacterales bacterium]